MNQIRIQYKCRSCGVVFEDDVFITEDMANVVLGAIVQQKPLPVIGCTTPPYLPSEYMIHTCKESETEDQKGIADVIGYLVLKDELTYPKG